MYIYVWIYLCTKDTLSLDNVWLYIYMCFDDVCSIEKRMWTPTISWWKRPLYRMMVLTTQQRLWPWKEKSYIHIVIIIIIMCPVSVCLRRWWLLPILSHLCVALWFGPQRIYIQLNHNHRHISYMRLERDWAYIDHMWWRPLTYSRELWMIYNRLSGRFTTVVCPKLD